LQPRGDGTVLLRAWGPGDLPVIAEASSDSYIPLITTIPVPYTPQQGGAWLRRQWDQAADGRGCPMAIVSRSSSETVGMATITGIDWTHRRAAIGYWILDRHRGRGFAKAAVSLLPGLARDLGLVRLEALIEPGNHASQAVCRALGFAAEGTSRSYYRIGGQNRDMMIFARLVPRSGSRQLTGPGNGINGIICGLCRCGLCRCGLCRCGLCRCGLCRSGGWQHGNPWRISRGSPMIARMSSSSRRADMFVDTENDPREAGPTLGDERATLVEYLRCQRLTLELKCSGLDAVDLARRSVEPSTMSLLGLVRHMADVERGWFRRVMARQDAPPHFRTDTDRDGDFDGAVPDPQVVAEAWQVWRAEVAFADQFVAQAPDLGVTGTDSWSGEPVSLREVLVHMVEEYARHNGHADLLRERIDGRLGQ
jgi:RimJ/RimL family protein N-acetyltransferase/uncharacterized damage-inducible protein DinB